MRCKRMTHEIAGDQTKVVRGIRRKTLKKTDTKWRNSESVLFSHDFGALFELRHIRPS